MNSLEKVEKKLLEATEFKDVASMADAVKAIKDGDARMIEASNNEKMITVKENEVINNFDLKKEENALEEKKIENDFKIKNAANALEQMKIENDYILKKEENALEEKKIENDYNIKRAELINQRINRVMDGCEKIIVGTAVVGVTAIGAKTVVEFEEKGLFASNMFSKEFIGQAIKAPLNWVFKLFRH